MYELRRAHFKGNNGKPGKGDKNHGTDGKDVHYTVPLGTEIYEVKMQQLAKELSANRGDQIKIKVADLDSEGAQFRLCKGGEGGSGNLTNKQLKVLQKGFKGEEKQFELRLKLIADVGFIGYPNAGKSTLLSAVRNLQTN